MYGKKRSYRETIINIHYQMNPEHVMKTGHDYAAVLQKKIDVMEY